MLIEQAFTNIVERRLDAGIRLGESLEKDVVAVPVSGPLRMAAIASPAYLKRHGVPKTPRELRSHRCINLRLPSAGTIYKWEFERGAEKMDIAVDGPLIFDAGGMVVDAALAGVGLGFVLEDRALDYSSRARSCACLRTGARPFRASICTTQAGVRCRRRSLPSSTRSACAATRKNAADC